MRDLITQTSIVLTGGVLESISGIFLKHFLRLVQDIQSTSTDWTNLAFGKFVILLHGIVSLCLSVQRDYRT